jgi:hypothetical protein
MTLEFHGRHQRVKDDIDLGILATVFSGKPAWKGTKIEFSALYDYAKKKVAIDPTGYRWLLEFCETWREVLSEVPGAAKRRRPRKKDPLEDSRLQDQRRHIMEKFKRLPPGLTVPKQAKALADDRSIGLSASTLLQMIRGDYPPWVARGWAGLKEQQRR